MRMAGISGKKRFKKIVLLKLVIGELQSSKTDDKRAKTISTIYFYTSKRTRVIFFHIKTKDTIINTQNSFNGYANDEMTYIWSAASVNKTEITKQWKNITNFSSFQIQFNELSSQSYDKLWYLQENFCY